MEIKLYNDVAFKWIFGRQQQTGPLIALINTVLSHNHGSEHGLEHETLTFSEVKILNPFDDSEPFKHEKQGILDIRAKDVHSKKWVDLEMQVRYSETYPQRAKFYLAGLYRDQLQKSAMEKYGELTPVYGIHLLLENLFREKADQNFWFNHYAMLNTRTHKPLVAHWHLFFIELKKCIRQIQKNGNKSPRSTMEQWAAFIATPQDNTKPLDPALADNSNIREVYDMLQTFTDQDHLREKYRIQEEFLRSQRSYQAEYEAALRIRDQALKEKEKERKEKEKERKEKEKERREKEIALKRLEEMENFKTNTIRTMKKQGNSKETIAQLLGLPIHEIDPFF